MSEADSLAEDSPGPQAEGTARSWRFGPEAAGSHRPLEEGRPPVLVAGRAVGWGCTGSPSNSILVFFHSNVIAIYGGWGSRAFVVTLRLWSSVVSYSTLLYYYQFLYHVVLDCLSRGGLSANV